MYMIIEKGDSGASAHYIRPQDSNILQNLAVAKDKKVVQPDRTHM